MTRKSFFVAAAAAVAFSLSSFAHGRSSFPSFEYFAPFLPHFVAQQEDGGKKVSTCLLLFRANGGRALVVEP